MQQFQPNPFVIIGALTITQMILWLASYPGWNGLFLLKGHQTPADQVVLLRPIRRWWSVMVSPGAGATIHVTSNASWCCVLQCLLSHLSNYMKSNTFGLIYIRDVPLYGMYSMGYFISLEICPQKLTFERWHEAAKGASNYCQAEHYPHTFTGDFMCYSAILFHSPRH